MLLLLVVPTFAADVLTIDDFTTYADTAASQAAYKPLKDTPPAEFFPHGDKSALRIPCLSATVPGLERGSYDVKVNLDLSRVHTITFDLYGDNPSGVPRLAIFLHSGKGWAAPRASLDDLAEVVLTPDALSRAAADATRLQQPNSSPP